MPTGFEDNDELLEAYLAESGEADLGEAPVSRLWADGREVGEWTVTGFLARGGSAEVYCVKHRRLGTRAAMKVLWRDGAGPEERFRKESLFLMEDPGPSFPAFYGAGVEDGHPWVAMELLDECPMPSSDREVARYLLDIGGGVVALHARGWLHRDLKPRNILRRADGHAVLADFGLLKAIGEDEMAVVGDSPSIVDGREVGVGTPGFSAPEQFSGGGATPAADVYAMGMLAEECFGGNPPRAWEKIIRRATAALPRQRYPDVEPMLRAIRLRHWSRNWLWALLAALGIALLGAAWAIRARQTSPMIAEPEQQEEPVLEEEAQAESVGGEAEQARAAAVRRASEGAGRDVVDGILRDMVVLDGAETLPNRLRKAFGITEGPVLVGRHEVTQAQWEALMESNPSHFKGADRPVDSVSIGDCLEFIGRLNRMPNVQKAGLRFRLPTMEEWEYAAGDKAIVYLSTTDFHREKGWYKENAGNETHPVGKKPQDEHGLYDFFGNVAELVFSVHSVKNLQDLFEVTGLSCMGGSCLKSMFDPDGFLAPLGREIETLPEEWQPIVRATGITAQLPEPMTEAPKSKIEKFLYVGLAGLRLYADMEPGRTVPEPQGRTKPEKGG